MRKLFCLLGWHQWVPVSWLTCNPHDRGSVCKRCFEERCEKEARSDG